MYIPGKPFTNVDATFNFEGLNKSDPTVAQSELNDYLETRPGLSQYGEIVHPITGNVLSDLDPADYFASLRREEEETDIEWTSFQAQDWSVLREKLAFYDDKLFYYGLSNDHEIEIANKRSVSENPQMVSLDYVRSSIFEEIHEIHIGMKEKIIERGDSVVELARIKAKAEFENDSHYADAITLAIEEKIRALSKVSKRDPAKHETSLREGLTIVHGREYDRLVGKYGVLRSEIPIQPQLDLYQESSFKLPPISYRLLALNSLSKIKKAYRYAGYKLSDTAEQVARKSRKKKFVGGVAVFAAAATGAAFGVDPIHHI
jgi:hypothetical protein